MWAIEWRPEAADSMITLWRESKGDAHTQLVAAFDAIVLQLESDPFGNSEGRANNQRIMFQPPLGLIYAVDSSSQVVTVGSIWRIGN